MRALQDLTLAWDNGYKDVILETDSHIGVKLINNELSLTNYTGALVDICKHLIRSEWRVEIKYIWREPSKIAD